MPHTRLPNRPRRIAPYQPRNLGPIQRPSDMPDAPPPPEVNVAPEDEQNKAPKTAERAGYATPVAVVLVLALCALIAVKIMDIAKKDNATVHRPVVNSH